MLTPKIPSYVQKQKEAEAKRKEAEERLLQQKQYRITVVYTVITGFGVAAAFIAGFFAFGQLNVLRKQVDLTISQLRPKLELTFKGPERPATLTVGSVKQTGWLITPTWENHGSADATDFWGWADIKFFSPDYAKSFDFVNRTIDSDQVPRTTVGPSEARLQKSQFVSEKDVTSAIAGTGGIIIWGYVEYLDSLPDGRLHKIHWCYVVAPVDAGDMYIFSYAAYRPDCNTNESYEQKAKQ
jgi:hypothetical protein